MSWPTVGATASTGRRATVRLGLAAALVALVALVVVGVLHDLGRHPRVSLELVRMAHEDGRLRRRLPLLTLGEKATPVQVAAIDRVERADARHTRRLRQIVHRWGWPGRGLAGTRGADAAWLLVQHADADRAFQRDMLALMRRSGDVPAHDIAFLTDRLLVADGSPQEYGTQFRCRDGVLEPVTPIRDATTVNARRARSGLPTFEEHRREIERRDGPCPKT